MTRLTLIKVSYTLHVIIMKIIPIVSPRNYVKEIVKKPQPTYKYKRANKTQKQTNKQITNYKPFYINQRKY